MCATTAGSLEDFGARSWAPHAGRACSLSCCPSSRLAYFQEKSEGYLRIAAWWSPSWWGSVATATGTDAATRTDLQGLPEATRTFLWSFLKEHNPAISLYWTSSLLLCQRTRKFPSLRTTQYVVLFQEPEEFIHCHGGLVSYPAEPSQIHWI